MLQEPFLPSLHLISQYCILVIELSNCIVSLHIAISGSSQYCKLCYDADHSLLTWSYHHGDNDYNDNDRLSIEPVTLTRYDVTDIPRDFMCDDVSIECCNELTANSDVTPVNESYEICSTLVKQNMNDMLPVKLITINGDRKTHRNKAKPWWSQNLTDLWKLRCDCEKFFCESNFNNRAIRREQFVNGQKSTTSRTSNDQSKK